MQQAYIWSRTYYDTAILNIDLRVTLTFDRNYLENYPTA